MKLSKFFKRESQFEKRLKQEEQSRQRGRERFHHLLDRLAPLASLPNDPPEIEGDTFVRIVEVVRGDPEQVVNAIWEKWRWHHDRVGPYGDPESARALEAFNQMLESGDYSCHFPWGVNTKEYRLYRSIGGDCMFVEIFDRLR